MTSKPVGSACRNCRDFRNYCIGCPECWREGKHACYVRRLESGRNTARTPRSLPCSRCGRRIGTGDKAGVDIYYDWPESTAGAGRSNQSMSAVGVATAAASVDTLVRGIPSGSFYGLSDSLQRKFVSAGLGGERGIRDAAEAQGFYHDSIPYSVRNLGEPTVRQFINGKDASHIQSVHNAPHLAASNGNIIWENHGLNQARGAENMTGGEQFSAHASNAFDATTIVFRDCMQAAAITAFYAALLEMPVAALENYFHYRRGRSTGEEAIKDAAKVIAARAAAGAVVGFAVTVTGAVALLGAGPLLVTIAPILAPVGIALYGYTAIRRILNAAQHDLPLDRVGSYFCSPRCHTKFAYENGQSGLMRWEANRVTSKA